MLSHDRVWAAIDTLAKINGMSPSGLARRAGLDPTTFNRSKRTSGDGRPRWPSTESISKVLYATSTAIGDFVMLMSPSPQTRACTQSAEASPLLTLRAGGGGIGENGLPLADAANRALSNAGSADTFALQVNGNSMLPHYRDGDTIIVSPKSPIRRGDRIALRLKNGDIAPWVLFRRTTNQIDLRAIGHERANRTVQAVDVDWMSRILWASQ